MIYTETRHGVTSGDPWRDTRVSHAVVQGVRPQPSQAGRAARSTTYFKRGYWRVLGPGVAVVLVLVLGLRHTAPLFLLLGEQHNNMLTCYHRATKGAPLMPAESLHSGVVQNR